MTHAPPAGRPFPAAAPLHLRPADWLSLPWKTGQGRTDEICLMPEDATRGAFDLRISSAPITAPGPFSAFCGVDRVITVIDGAGLELDFGSGVAQLAPLRPFRFDSGLTPIGRPRGGGVRVMNVMAARDRWHMAAVRVARGPFRAAVPEGGLGIILALAAGWRAAGCRLAPRDTLILPAGTGLDLSPAPREEEGAALEVILVAQG